MVHNSHHFIETEFHTGKNIPQNAVNHTWMCSIKKAEMGCFCQVSWLISLALPTIIFSTCWVSMKVLVSVQVEADFLFSRFESSIENDRWVHGVLKFLFECATQYLLSEGREQVTHWVELNTRREISFLQATMYYFVYYVKIGIDEIPLDNDDNMNVIYCICSS